MASARTEAMERTITRAARRRENRRVARTGLSAGGGASKSEYEFGWPSRISDNTYLFH